MAMNKAINTKKSFRIQSGGSVFPCRSASAHR